MVNFKADKYVKRLTFFASRLCHRLKEQLSHTRPNHFRLHSRFLLNLSFVLTPQKLVRNRKSINPTEIQVSKKVTKNSKKRYK